MNTVDTLVTKYVLDPTGYQHGANQVIQATNKTAQAQAGMSDYGRHAQEWIKTLSGVYSAGASIVTGYAAAIVTATAALGAMALTSMSKAGEFEALTKALESVEGSTRLAANELKRLQEIAKSPGIGFEEAVQGYTQLRRSGLTQGFSERLMKEFANQNALSGGGQAEFARLMRASNQIATKPFLQGDELLQLTEAGLPAHKMVKDAFGTSDTEELKRRGITSAQVLETLVAAMEQTARVGGSAKNSFENLGQALEQAWVSGGNAFNDKFLPRIEAFTKSIEDFTSEGGVSATFDAVATSIESVIDSMTGGGNFTDALKTVAAGFVTFSQHLMYFFLNLQDIWNALPISKIVGAIETPAFDQNLKDIEATMETQRLATEMRKRIESKNGGELESAINEALTPFGAGGSGLSNTATSEIEHHTRRTAQNTERMAINFERFAFGGGELGKLGVTPSEFRRGLTIHAPKGPTVVMDPQAYITDIVGQALMHVRS